MGFAASLAFFRRWLNARFENMVGCYGWDGSWAVAAPPPAPRRSSGVRCSSARVGDPTRDELQRTPEECSGAGYRDAEDELGTGDPEACVCDPGFEGDKCEIHPCGYRGTLVFLDPETGEKTCECVDKFSGDMCDVECSGNGEYDEDSGECKCGKGWTGILCDAACDGCDGAVVLYTQCNSRGLYWLRRLAHLFGPITIPTIVCAHKSDLHATFVPAWLHQFPTVEHTNTRLERRVGIVDCANRIIMRARRTLASPLAVHGE